MPNTEQKQKHGTQLDCSRALPRRKAASGWEYIAFIALWCGLVALLFIRASGQTITGLERLTNRPATHFEGRSGNGSGLIFHSNYCEQVRLTVNVTAGVWQVWWNYDPQGARPTHPNCVEGQAWQAIKGATLTGPATNGTVQFPMPPTQTGFYQLRRL